MRVFVFKTPSPPSPPPMSPALPRSGVWVGPRPKTHDQGARCLLLLLLLPSSSLATATTSSVLFPLPIRDTRYTRLECVTAGWKISNKQIKNKKKRRERRVKERRKIGYSRKCVESGWSGAYEATGGGGGATLIFGCCCCRCRCPCVAVLLFTTNLYYTTHATNDVVVVVVVVNSFALKRCAGGPPVEASRVESLSPFVQTAISLCRAHNAPHGKQRQLLEGSAAAAASVDSSQFKARPSFFTHTFRHSPSSSSCW